MVCREFVGGGFVERFVSLRGLVGPHGMVWGLSHFGYSAPYAVLDDKFGFTPQKVAEKVREMLRANA